MTKRNQILYLITAIIVFIIIDRNLWMEERVKKNCFLWESGTGLGDPISYNQDFKINGSQITFEKEKDSIDWPKIAEHRKHKFYFVGCYFGSLYIYDKTTNKMAIYSEK